MNRRLAGSAVGNRRSRSAWSFQAWRPHRSSESKILTQNALVELLSDRAHLHRTSSTFAATSPRSSHDAARTVPANCAASSGPATVLVLGFELFPEKRSVMKQSPQLSQWVLQRRSPVIGSRWLVGRTPSGSCTANCHLSAGALRPHTPSIDQLTLPSKLLMIDNNNWWRSFWKFQWGILEFCIFVNLIRWCQPNLLWKQPAHDLCQHVYIVNLTSGRRRIKLKVFVR